MRIRLNCNPYRDQHHITNPAFSMRVYEFITHSGTNPHDVALAIENAIPELCLFGRGSTLKQRRYDQVNKVWIEETVNMPSDHKQGYVNGAVWTSWHQDDPEAEPCLHVGIGLYDTACNDPLCIAGHMNRGTATVYRKAPALTAWQLDAIKEEVGEHPNYKLGVSRASDQHILSGLGFLPIDAPLLGEDVGHDNLHLALDVLARTSESTFVYKLFELTRLGFDVDIELVQHIMRARKIQEATIANP